MSLQHAVILVASLPLIAAFVCRANAMTDGPGRLFAHPIAVTANLALLIGSGWVFFSCLQVPPHPMHWAAVLLGWVWIVATLPSMRRALSRAS